MSALFVKCLKSKKRDYLTFYYLYALTDKNLSKMDLKAYFSFFSPQIYILMKLTYMYGKEDSESMERRNK